MSMFGAVDLSSLRPQASTASTAPAGAAASGGAQEPGQALPAPLIVDVDASRLREVAELSTQAPIVIVLYSPRSAVSQDLADLMARQAVAYGGRFQLARVDVDAAPEVAQALQVQAVPSVMALLAGQPVPMFQGVAEESQVTEVLDQLLALAARNGITGRVSGDDAQPEEPDSPESEVERAAREAMERGDWKAAEEVYDHAIAQNPGDNTLKVARDQVRMLARMEGQDPAALIAAADADPTDLDKALAGADGALALGDISAALGRALEAVRSHSGPDREKARLRLLELFAIIGDSAPEVVRARRQLASLLF